MDNRKAWVNYLTKISEPVMLSFANDNIKEKMPVETSGSNLSEQADKHYCTYLEALARTFYGLSPWFNAKKINDEELKLQNQYRELTLKALKNAVDNNSNSFVFTKKDNEFLPQILVDSSFLAFGLINSKDEIWDNLDNKTKENIIKYFKETKSILPYSSNWILFSALIEVFFLVIGEDYDIMRIDYSLKQFEQWYVGDAIYKDGENLHSDYYNSYVIQPFILEILKNAKDVYRDFEDFNAIALIRAKRYAKIQEMTINVDGTFPAIGRSITYRCGAFHHLAYCAKNNILPEELSKASARSALIKTISRCLQPKNTFDENGWLKIGLSGHQPSLGENYITTGSLYLCTFAFLPLALDGDDIFWTSPDEKYSAEKIWSGFDAIADHAIDC